MSENETCHDIIIFTTAKIRNEVETLHIQKFCTQRYYCIFLQDPRLTFCNLYSILYLMSQKFWLWIVITGWSFCLLLVFAHFTWKSLKVLSVNILNKSVYNIYFIINQQIFCLLYDTYDVQLITWIIWHYSCSMKHILVISISRLFDRQKERTQQTKISSQASRWNNDFIWFTSDQTSQWWPRNRSYL